MAISNKVFIHLGRPIFLLCPVEYCSNRADPSVKKSDYLKTLGSDLENEIKIFWTGSKVVSENIKIEEIKGMLLLILFGIFVVLKQIYVIHAVHIRMPIF